MEPTPNPNSSPVPAQPVPESQLVTEKPIIPAAGSPELQPSQNQGAPAQTPQQSVQAPAGSPISQQPIAPGAPVQVPPPAHPPVASDDVDVIEKEWVDQAEKVIEQTKNDPHAEEEAVESLQIDYLKKRYGHDVSKPKDS